MDSSDMGFSDKGSSEMDAPESASSAGHTGLDQPNSANESANAGGGHEAGNSPGTSAVPAVSGTEIAAAADRSPVVAKPRPGSSLILIPPVTRKTDGAHAGPPPLGNDAAASAAGFGTDRAAKRRFFKAGWLRYAAPAVLAFCLFGIGLATGGQFFGGAPANSPLRAVVGGPKAVQAALDQNEMQRLTQKFDSEIQALQSRVDSLRAAVQAAAPEDARGLQKSMDGLRASLDAAKAETSASIAQLNARVDRLQHGEAKPQAPADKMSHAEHSAAAQPGGAATHFGPTPMPAAMNHPAAGPQLPKEQAQPVSPEAKKKPQPVLVDWVVRDVYRGLALVDGPDGTIEVGRGDIIPGAGTVESIERRNGAWVLITNRGIVGSVRD